ncbi:MAG: TetR/AcrR family transcriptional regulator [Gammaproteobacteria bacterium]
MSAAPSPRRTRREVSPEQVISSALSLFLERGFAATRMEDVATLAGVSKGAIYLHFPNKEALFHEVVRSGVLSRLEQAEATVASHQGSARELLDGLMHGVLLEFWGSASSGIPKLIIAEAQAFPELARDYFHEVSLRTRGLLENILEGGVASGEFRPMDIAYTARAILSALEHQPVMHHSLGIHDPEPLEPVRFVDAMLDLVSTGLLKSPGTGTTR